MDRGHTSPSRRWTSTTTGSSPSTRWKQGLHCFCFPQQTFLTTSKWFKLNDMHVKALYASLSLTPGERVPEEGVWAPWLPSQRHSTREHGGGYLRQRGWEQRRLHILKRVYVQTRWTLTVLMQSASHFTVEILWCFGVHRKLSLRLPESISVLQKHVCIMCDVWTPVWRFVRYDWSQQGFFNQFISVVFCLSRYLCFLCFYLFTWKPLCTV